MARRKTPHARVLLGLGLVSLLALGSALSFYNTARLAMAEGDPYRMEQQLRRFQAATSNLPADAPVGYLSEVPSTEAAGRIRFLIARYALAPALLVPYDKQQPTRFVIGEFAHSGDAQRFAADNKFLPVRVYEQGLVLFERLEH